MKLGHILPLRGALMREAAKVEAPPKKKKREPRVGPRQCRTLGLAAPIDAEGRYHEGSPKAERARKAGWVKWLWNREHMTMKAIEDTLEDAPVRWVREVLAGRTFKSIAPACPPASARRGHGSSNGPDVR